MNRNRMHHDDHAPRHTVRYGMRMVLSLVAAFALLFAVIRFAGEFWPTVVAAFLAVFVTVAFLSVLGVIIDLVEFHAARRRRGRLSWSHDEAGEVASAVSAAAVRPTSPSDSSEH